MWQILVIIVCLGLNALIAASELAFVSLSKPHLRHLVAKGEKGAERILTMRENPERILSVLQVGQTFISIVAAAVGGIKVDAWATPFFTQTLGLGPSLSTVLSIVIFVIPYTLITVVISELLPKSLALRNPKWVIYKVDRGITFLCKIFSPLIFLLEKSTKLCAKLFHPWVAREEMESGEWILVGKLVRPYMRNLASVEEKRLIDAMIPWEAVDTVSLSADIDTVEKVVLETGHTRLPVLDGLKPVSLLHTKEFHAFQQNQDPNWQSILRPLVTFDEKVSPISALRKMQNAHSHLGVVFAKERPIGIVTIEDILEEVVGEIYDEDDSTGPKQAPDT